MMAVQPGQRWGMTGKLGKLIGRQEGRAGGSGRPRAEKTEKCRYAARVDLLFQVSIFQASF